MQKVHNIQPCTHDIEHPWVLETSLKGLASKLEIAIVPLCPTWLAKAAQLATSAISFPAWSLVREVSHSAPRPTIQSAMERRKKDYSSSGQGFFALAPSLFPKKVCPKQNWISECNFSKLCKGFMVVSWYSSSVAPTGGHLPCVLPIQGESTGLGLLGAMKPAANNLNGLMNAIHRDVQCNCVASTTVMTFSRLVNIAAGSWQSVAKVQFFRIACGCRRSLRWWISQASATSAGSWLKYTTLRNKLIPNNHKQSALPWHAHCIKLSKVATPKGNNCSDYNTKRINFSKIFREDHPWNLPRIRAPVGLQRHWVPPGCVRRDDPQGSDIRKSDHKGQWHFKRSILVYLPFKICLRILHLETWHTDIQYP